MGTDLILPHFGEVVARHFCDTHGLELYVKSSRSDIEYLCWLPQCRDGAQMADVGQTVEIVEFEINGGFTSYYIVPVTV